MDVIGGMGDPKQVGDMIAPIVHGAVEDLQATIEAGIEKLGAGLADELQHLPSEIVNALEGLTITITISRKT